MNFYLYVITPLLSFIGGFFAYILTLKIVWEQSLSGGDMKAVLLWGGIAFFLLATPIYLGITYFIDKKCKKIKGLLYPAGCILVFFIPTLFVTLSFGSMNPFSPEAMLFHSFFLTSGLIFGLCSWGFKRIKATPVI
ncbi:hypothetical protein QTL97_09725 [Sporosarcina thermotolerans]|uniref:Uncharacterized protein n=1 Tax=Sporosarcina thermotolerans TaxID=633404 RepID=A0AAW9AC72_9BACL|nr:hypothetical protein [Sporosarcina thermotolerans]MDW0117216.1 hypothetical protein [Sporosarcina thermotolerans]